jgi:transcriptional regulator with XRE-family HTH domain
MMAVDSRDKTTKAVAANLRAVLKQKGMTPADLQKVIGAATSSAIYDFLSGRTRSLRVETLAKFADGLDIAVVELFSEPDAREHDLDRDSDDMDRDALLAAARAMRAAIRAHRDASEHALCWHHPAMWALLPDPPKGEQVVPDWPQFLRGCIRYRASLDAQLPQAPRTDREFGE